MSNNEATGKNEKIISVILGIYIISIGFGLPLVVRDFYFDILIFKYYYYCFCTISMIVIVLGYALINQIKDKSIIIKGFRIETLVGKLTIVDLFVLLYWFIAIISTITSDYFYEAFWGNEGRYTGLFLITWYVLSYFCVSRFWKFKSWYIDIMLFAGILVCIFGITDYFNLDIFSFKAQMMPEQKPIFTSTIGNINTYTAYVGIISAIGTVLFTAEKKMSKAIWYYICMIISFFAIIMGVSDNAYLSLGALFVFLPIYLFKNKFGVKKYLIILATFFTVTQCIDWINNSFRDKVLGIDSAFDLVISFSALHYLVLLLWIMVFVLHIFDLKRSAEIKNYGNKLVTLWLVLIAAGAIGILFALYDCNIAGNADRYSFASNYLLFNDNWGTHRGFIWRNAMECFLNLPLWKKIIGYGPETFGILLLRKTVNNPYNEIFDSAHNEYLHTLITVGIFGLISYVSLLLFFIKNCLKNKSNNAYVVAVVFGVICYSVQAFVNLNLPIVTPIFWLLIGIGSVRSID